MKYINRHKQILWILAITIVFRLLLYPLSESFILLQYDSDSYSKFTENVFSGPQLRTPLYPLFIMFVRFISFSPDGYIPIVIAQEIVSLVSLVFMYKIVTRYTQNSKMIYILTLAYSLQPTIWHWNKCILTESLSISFSVIFAWILIYHLDKPKIWSAITLTAGSFLLVMLRASFLALFAVIIAFWIVRFFISKTDRKQSIIGFGSSLFCVFLLFGYMHLNYLQHGWKSITNVSTANQIMNLIDSELYENPNYQDLTDSLTQNKYWYDRKNMFFYLAWTPVSEEFGSTFEPQYVQSYVKDTIKLHLADYIRYTGRKFINLAGVPVLSVIPLSTPTSLWNDILAGSFDFAAHEAQMTETSEHWNIITIVLLAFFMFPVFFLFVYIYLSWAFIYTIVKWLKGKPDWIDLGFSLIIISQLVTIVISVSDDHGRLFQPALPFLFALVYKHISEGKFDWLKMKWIDKIFEKQGSNS